MVRLEAITINLNLPRIFFAQCLFKRLNEKVRKIFNGVTSQGETSKNSLLLP